MGHNAIRLAVAVAVALALALPACGGGETDPDAALPPDAACPLPELPSGAWSAGPPMPGERYSHSMVTFGGKIYVFGGSLDTQLDDLLVFDPMTDTWTALDPMPEARTGGAAAVWRDKIVLIGGYTRTPVEGPVDSTLTYDPATGEWGELAALPVFRSMLAAATVGDHLLAVGGLGAEGPVDTVSRYDPDADAWTAVAPLHQARFGALAVSTGDRVIVAGGFALGEELASVEELAAPFDTVNDLSPMLHARGAPAGAYLDGFVYAMSGVTSRFAEESEQTSAERLDLATGAWEAIAPLADHRRDAAAVSAFCRVYVTGGTKVVCPDACDMIHLDSMEVYVP